MERKDNLKKFFRKFSDFLAIAAAKEMDYFITDAEYTSAFNYRMQKIQEEIIKNRHENLNISVMFNTKGEIAVISAEIIGNYISDSYCVKIQEYYKDKPVNKIICDVANATEKAQKDFTIISYKILYDTLDILYKDISCKREIKEKLVSRFHIEDNDRNDMVLILAVMLILEDVCKYIGIEEYKVIEYINNHV